MAYSSRSLLLHGSVGVIIAVLIIAAVNLPVISPILVEAKIGTLAVKVTDAPVPYLRNLHLAINSVEVLGKTGDWNKLPINGGLQYFDLLQLQNVTKDLSVGSIHVGNYTRIRLQIVSANATLDDGRNIALNVPSGNIDIQVHFEVKLGKTTSLIVEIIVDKIQIAERGNSGKPANLNPQFKAIIIPPP
ncbi:DUF4382 domain-containing protein [Candidatus Bathyarchaeota archaeon]|nr:DUF4382 domain-containing protein [Candidatus Bathyarchaeota archaeon]